MGIRKGGEGQEWGLLYWQQTARGIKMQERGGGGDREGRERDRKREIERKRQCGTE